ncbi:MAG: ABC transporter permease [Chloroflexia bacterium]
MNFRKILLIIKREYMEKLKSPGFAIGTIGGVVVIVGLSFLPMLLQLLDQGPTRVVVVDPRNLIYEYIPQTEATDQSAPAPGVGGQAAAPSQASVIKFSKADTEDVNELSRRAREDKISAFVAVEGDRPSNVQFTIYAKDKPSPATLARIQALLNAAVVQARLLENGLTAAQVGALFTPAPLKAAPLAGGTLKDESKVFQSQALVYALLLFLYVSTIVYGIQVATGVVWEKSSRVMEILLTSLRPIELMFGKILGLGLLGLSQYTLWVIIGFGGLVVSAALTNPGGPNAATTAGAAITAVPPSTLLYFLLFFVLGYLVYASLYAALGSLVNRIEDVNSVTTPLNIVLIVTYFLSIYALGNPEAAYVKWLSYVPFFTPMLMFIRVSLSDPAWWEPLLAILLMVAAIFLFTWIAAKIYRVGVLLYGKRPSIREIGRLLRAA